MALSDHGQYSGVVDIARNGIDEVIRLQTQAKQDEALIRQMLNELEFVDECGNFAVLDPIALKSALTAARARLGEKP